VSTESGAPGAGATHVVDRFGEVWKIVRDGGMVTRADFDGIKSAGIDWLEREVGPLLPFDPMAYRREYPRTFSPAVDRG
jgi:hypothetical protein